MTAQWVMGIGKNVCRSDRILNRKVYAEATNWRHRMGGITDAEKAGRHQLLRRSMRMLST